MAAKKARKQKKSAERIAVEEKLREQRMAAAAEATEEVGPEQAAESAAMRKALVSMLTVAIDQAKHWTEEKSPGQRFEKFSQCLFAFGQASSMACPRHVKEAWESVGIVACHAAAEDEILREELGLLTMDGRRGLSFIGKKQLTSSLSQLGELSPEQGEGLISGLSGAWTFGAAPKVGLGQELGELSEWISSAGSIVAMGTTSAARLEIEKLFFASGKSWEWPRKADRASMSAAEIAAIEWLGDVLPMLRGEVRRENGLATMMAAAGQLAQCASQANRPSEEAETIDRLAGICKEGWRFLEKELISSGRACDWREINDSLSASSASSWAAGRSAYGGESAAKDLVIFDAVGEALKSGKIPMSQSAIDGILDPLLAVRAMLHAISEATELGGIGGGSAKPARRAMRM